MVVTEEKAEQLLERVTALEDRVAEPEQENEEPEQENQPLEKRTSASEPRSDGTRDHIRHRVKSNQIKGSRPRLTKTRTTNSHELKLSGASAWHAIERAACPGRCEYERIPRQIQQADVVHIDETEIKRDGEQA